MKFAWALVAVTALVCIGCKPAKAILNQRLIDACEKNDADAAKAALDQGADPNAVDPNPNRGFAAVVLAVDKPEIEAMLLKAGASPSKLDGNGLLPLGYAAAAGDASTMELLIKAGAKIDEKDSNGNTALYQAASSGKLDNTMYLVACKAKVDEPNKHGRTPLFGAVTGAMVSKKDRLTTIRFLVQNGADVAHKDDRGHIALDYAKSKLAKAFGSDSEETALLTPKSSQKH